MKAAAAAALLAVLAPQARAYGPAAGIPAAEEAAGPRLEGAELVEIEGFAAPNGDIPCPRKTYSNTWHYKFHSGGQWLIVNACGGDFLNAARHLTYSPSEEPTRRLPASFAAPAEVLKKLADEKAFTPVPNPLGDRDVLMRVRYLPQEKDRPAGCYWFVSQGKAKALTDCAAEKVWKLSAPAQAAAKGGAAGPAVKGKDTAGRYTDLALNTVRRKYPGARLMLVETLADRTGSAKCIEPKDGWSFVFAAGATPAVFGGCKGRTAAEYIVFDGQKPVDRTRTAEITLPFKDSDFALSQVPKSCAAGHATVSMQLVNFKPAYAPAAGHSEVWIIDCGTQRHYVDAQTGRYIKQAAR